MERSPDTGSNAKRTKNPPKERKKRDKKDVPRFEIRQGVFVISFN